MREEIEKSRFTSLEKLLLIMLALFIFGIGGFTVGKKVNNSELKDAVTALQVEKNTYKNIAEIRGQIAAQTGQQLTELRTAIKNAQQIGRLQPTQPAPATTP